MTQKTKEIIGGIGAAVLFVAFMSCLSLSYTKGLNPEYIRLCNLLDVDH